VEEETERRWIEVVNEVVNEVVKEVAELGGVERSV
jgi:hypothetical protein